jgi:nicotinamide riboside kinase
MSKMAILRQLSRWTALFRTRAKEEPPQERSNNGQNGTAKNQLKERECDRIYSRDMEPAEKLVRRLLKFAFMILAFIVSIVFGEFYRGMGWVGALIFVVGASMGALGTYLLKDLRN